MAEGQVDILFLGEAPGPAEVAAGEPFVGESGELLRETLSGFMPDKTVCFDNAYNEYLGKKPNGQFVAPNIKQIRSQSERLDTLFSQAKPKVVMALGNCALGAFDEKMSGITRRVGAVFKAKGQKVVPCVHPSFVVRDRHTNMHFWERGFRVLDKQFTRDRIKTRLIGDLGWLSCWLQNNQYTKCGFDLETSGFDYRDHEVLCAGISNGSEHIWFPLFHPEGDTFGGSRLKMLLEWWPLGPRVVHNLKFDLGWMRHYQRTFLRMPPLDPPEMYDTMLEAWLINENVPRGLDHLVINVLHEKPYWHALPEDGQDWASVPIKILGPYNAKDARACLKAHKIHQKILDDDRKALLDGVLTPLAGLLQDMEHRGIQVHLPKICGMMRNLKTTIEQEEGVLEKTWPTLNINSHKQMTALCTGLGLKSPKKTPKGAPSYNQKALELMAEHEPLLRGIVRLRKADNLLNKELDPLVTLNRNGLIHTSFNLGFVTTGRLSSSEPNLQNLTKPDKVYGLPNIRTVFRSRYSRGKLIQGDYGQHELRFMAYIANVRRLVVAFDRGINPHQAIATQMGLDYPKGKALNFSLIYGVGAGRLVGEYGWDIKDARKWRVQWMKLHPEVTEYHEQLVSEVEEHGYVTNMFGRRRHFSDITDKHQKNQAYNFPIQSAAVELVYMAMLKLEVKLRQYEACIVHQIHDSIVVDSPASEVKDVSEVMRQTMLDFPELPIPLAVDIEVKSHL